MKSIMRDVLARVIVDCLLRAPLIDCVKRRLVHLDSRDGLRNDQKRLLIFLGSVKA